MGLDQYAYKSKVSSDEFTPDNHERIFYWRKNPDLHGWMEKLWEQRNEDTIINNPEMQFNTVYLELTLDDLTDLEYQNEGETLPETTGFFFGKTDETDKEKNKEFIEIARQAINDDYRVYYFSWW
jgi:hypothetical protein